MFLHGMHDGYGTIYFGDAHPELTVNLLNGVDAKKEELVIKTNLVERLT